MFEIAYKIKTGTLANTSGSENSCCKKNKKQEKYANIHPYELTFIK